MLKIGLTGGIGSGKSVVAKVFETLGIPVFYADAEAKKLMEEDERLAEAISSEFGKEAYADKKLNRPFLARLVFNDPFKLEKLNALVHPATLEAADRWMQRQTAPYVIKEAALLFEAGSAGKLHKVVGVYAPQHLRLKRVMDRDGITREEVLARMSRQIEETIKMKLCDHVVVNDEQQLVIPQVWQLHQQFLAEANNFLPF